MKKPLQKKAALQMQEPSLQMQELLTRAKPSSKRKAGNRLGNLYQEIDKYEIPEDEIIPLTEKEELFCQAFIKDPNATKAAAAAGYPQPQQSGTQLKKRTVIRLRLAQLYQEKKKRFILDKEDVLEEFSRIGTVDITDFVDISRNGDLTLKESFNGKMVKGISSSVDKWGDNHLKIEFWDKNKALDSLAKYHKLFMDTIDGGESAKVQEVRIGDMVVTF